MNVTDELAEKRKKLQEMRNARQAGSNLKRNNTQQPAEPRPASTPSTEESSRPSTTPVYGGVSSVTQREASRIVPKPVNLTKVFPASLTWNVAPAGKVDSYPKSVQTDIDTSVPVEKEAPKVDSARRATVLGAALTPPTTENKAPLPESDNEEPEELTDTQKHDILRSNRFRDFFETTSFIVERALTDRDILPPGMTDSSETVFVRGQGDPLIRNQTFNDAQLSKKITKGCPITSVDFNPSVQEWFLASYYKQPEGQGALVDVEGQVLVWNMKIDRPYKSFTAPADVAKCMFSKFHRDLFIGGLYNGQVCVWDTRSGSDPVSVTPLTMNGHTHPVVGMDVVGNVNFHSLVTVSSDGKMCQWGLEKMNAPIETHTWQPMVTVGGTPVPREIQATSLAFRDTENNKFYLGFENGGLMSCTRASGTPSPDLFDGHTSPISSLHCHPANPQAGGDDYTDLVLTSSMDWTCKLWHPSKKDAPLFSFNEYEDYVYDVKWSPVHPGVFASCDGTGSLSLWNLLDTMEMSVGKVTTSNKAASRLAWSGDGKSIAVGDAGGDITLWDVVGQESAPKAADWPLLGQKLSEINAVC